MISGGKVLSAHPKYCPHTRKTSRGITCTSARRCRDPPQQHRALGAFYRRLAGRIVIAEAVTATARTIAVLCRLYRQRPAKSGDKCISEPPQRSGNANAKETDDLVFEA
jgi:hypothetical protein